MKVLVEMFLGDEARWQTLDHIIAKLSKEKKPHNGVEKKSRILLVSETNNACLSLSSSDEENEEGGEPDLHQCGHCRQMFFNFTKYITHKLQKACWNSDEQPTPTNEDEEGETPPWPPSAAAGKDGNGIASPPGDESGVIEDTEDMETEVTGNVEVKNLQQELQRRKHRKGMVRRIKPNDEVSPEELGKREMIVYVPADDDTVYVQQENVEESENSPNGEPSDEPLRIPVAEETVSLMEEQELSTRPSSSYKYGVSLYNYSKTKLKSKPETDKLLLAKTQNRNDGTARPTYSQHPHYPPRGQFPGSYYQDYPPKHEHGFYGESTAYPPQGNSGHYSPKYKKSKYYDEPPTSFYPPHTIPPLRQSKTPMYNRTSDKYNKNGTYSSYDKYRTMANLPQGEGQQHQQTVGTNPNKSLNEKSNGNDSKSPPNENIETNNEVKNINNEEPTTHQNTTNNPPQLVHILNKSQQQQQQPQQSQGGGESIADNTSTFDKSPPALEKHEVSFAGDDLLKTEDDNTRDSLNDTEENKDDNHDDVTSPAATKFLMSPDKESNSPPGSANSHETEDYNTEGPSRDLQTEINKLPRVRQLSESTVERLITEPSQTDASWKHAKQAYRCPLCAKVFPFKSKLQRHVLVHTGIKPYKCTVCGRGFTQQIDLQRHLTRHTGEKPFKCHLCKAQFIRADNLRKHCKDAHYVSIEEPIRKRRRKTTGSDTVLPPLEVAIALALSETERNGGRVLGRATTRTSTRTTASSNTKPRYAQGDGSIPKAPPSRGAPDERHPPGSMYPPRMSSRGEGGQPPSGYPPNYPPHLGPRHQQNVRYPFHHDARTHGAAYPPPPHHPPQQRRQHSPPAEFHHPSSPSSYHRNRDRRYMHLDSPSSSRYYHHEGPPPPPGARGYYSHHEDRYHEKEERDPRDRLPSSTASKEKYQDYHSVSLEQSQSQSSGGYPPHKRSLPPDHPNRPPHAEDSEYSHEGRKEDDYSRLPSSQDKLAPYRMSSSQIQQHSPVDYIQPREREEESAYRGGEDRDRPRNPYSAPPRSEEDHRALFRGKPSISYGDYGTTSKTSSRPSSDVSMVPQNREYNRSIPPPEATSPYQPPQPRSSTTSSEPGDFASMVDKDALIEPRPSSSPPPPPQATEDINEDNVYSDEIPIVTPSDDNTLTVPQSAVSS
ncbi:uncharacterized protein [Clytia hemisphaerica]|uniref:C2H2-type domain-containing protein n=1 Tax=Clytia hemisphaerica TaxID=252671 RepID=A0A7M6DM12_9CNID